MNDQTWGFDFVSFVCDWVLPQLLRIMKHNPQINTFSVHITGIWCLWVIKKEENILVNHSRLK